MICIRPAQNRDIPYLMAIARGSSTAARWNEQQYAKILASEPREHVCLVVCEDEHTVGFLVSRSVTPDEGEWEIENVAVADSAQRRGLASRLLGEFLNIVRDRGARRVFLEVRESNYAARRLYEKFDFVEAGRRKSYYHSPEEDALILRFTFLRPD
jgi:ribosomal-protein-alanine N-acetyltransferase